MDYEGEKKYPTSHQLKAVRHLANKIAHRKRNACVFQRDQPQQHVSGRKTLGGQGQRGGSKRDINDVIMGDGEVMICA